MNKVRKIQYWGNNHHPPILSVVRVILGFYLFLKGCSFFHNINFLERSFTHQNVIYVSPFLSNTIIYLAVIVHLIGGILIILGIYTRGAALIQLPFAVSAIFVINFLRSPYNTEIWTSVATVVLLLIFIIIGSGTFSLDFYLDNLIPHKENFK